jgi:hypothetical protein
LFFPVPLLPPLPLPIIRSMAPPNGYGTVNGSASTTASCGGDEEQPLLHKRGWRVKMTTDVHRDWADLVLLLCYIITGMLDSSAISTWGSFVSMQTGMTSTLSTCLPACMPASSIKAHEVADAKQATQYISAWDSPHPTSRRGGSSRAPLSVSSASAPSSSATSTDISRPRSDGCYARPS